MYFGVDYHPEQWVFPYAGTSEKPEAQWQIDAELMAAAGFNVIRIAEFSWSLCEPEDGKFDFAWLRRVMDVMGKAGLQVVLATPTAAMEKFMPRLAVGQNNLQSLMPSTYDARIRRKTR